MLLTLDNLADRGQYVNARNTFTELLAYGAVPVVNENVRLGGTRGCFGQVAGSRASREAGAWHSRPAGVAEAVPDVGVGCSTPQDTVAVQELRFGDNDTLSALVRGAGHGRGCDWVGGRTRPLNLARVRPRSLLVTYPARCRQPSCPQAL